jgi:transcriptional regulator with XRE-family HTH domain
VGVKGVGLTKPGICDTISIDIMARDTDINNLDLSQVPEERIMSDGRRRLMLTASERKEIRKKRKIDQLVTLFLDVERGLSRQQMADELGVSLMTIKAWTKEQHFIDRYTERMLDIANDPRASASQAAMMDALPLAANTVRELLESNSDQVRLRAAKMIFDMVGLEPPKTASNDRSEVAAFLKSINIEGDLNLRLEVPQEYIDAQRKHDPRQVIDVEAHDVPTSETNYEEPL